MNKGKICINIIATLSCFLSFAQLSKEGIQDLISEIENTSDNYSKLKLLDSLTHQLNTSKWNDFEYYKQNYPKYTFLYIDIAKGIDSIDLAASRTARLTNHYLQIVGKPDSAAVIIANIINDSAKFKKRINLGHLYLKRAGTFYLTEELGRAVVDYQNAERIYHQTKDTIFEADAIYFEGQARERLGELTTALLKYQKAGELYAKMKDTAYVAYTGLGVSGIFSQLYVLDKSFEERQRIRNLLEKQKNKDYQALSELAINDARDYVKRKEFGKEGQALLRAFNLIKDNENYEAQRFRVRSYISEYYSKQNQPELAKKYLDTLEQFPDLVNNSYDRIFYLKALGRYKIASQQYKEAIPIFKEEIEIFEKSKDVRGQVHLEKELHNAYSKLGQFSEASKHLERHILLKDSMYDLTRSNSLIYYQNLYEKEKRENQIAAQKANIQLLEQKDKAKRNLLIFGGIGLSLLFLSAFLYRNRVYLLRNKKLQQSFLQELLQTQERVSKRISKDLHDSVGQSLLIIKNKVLQNDDKKTAQVVDGVIDEVRSISRTLHPFKLEESGLTVTLESSVETIDETYDIFISAEIDNIDQVFDQEREINIYRLVQESFNNIIKHSNARSAEIKVVNKKNDVEIVIKDNGKGFDVSKEKTSASKIGLKTLSERSKFLKASFKILSEIDNGTTLIFKIPKYV